LRMEDVHAVDLHPQLAVPFCKDGDVRLAEDNEQVALAGVLEVTARRTYSPSPRSSGRGRDSSPSGGATARRCA
jgi:hypothetical protein